MIRFILETTRGAKGRELGQNRATEVDRLVSQISTVLDRGSCLIPVFFCAQANAGVIQNHLRVPQLRPNT